jgi:molybdopterin/thiamine biosynthesis adenylyltransferase
MSRTRWWETPGRSVAAEAAWFAEEGLEFDLDEDLFRMKDVVVFHGLLRLGERTTPASVHFPPAYASGAHPVVVAPELRLGRHQAPDGTLCLDHPVLGQAAPMYGAEAAARAQRLWELWETDREQLRREEADAPDPRANYYEYAPDSAVLLIDVDVAGFESGFFRLGALQVAPLRGGVTEVRATTPNAAVMTPGPAIDSFAGPLEINGAWRRVDSAPPFSVAELRDYVTGHHRAWVDEQVRFAKAWAQAHKRPDAPAVIAFVYPDEGPRRGEIHDAWLFVVIDVETGTAHIPHAFHLRTDERWLRQPQLRPLETKRVGIVGVGALGSPLADLLAKAGVGAAFYLDYDIVTVGNRVRHQLDLSDLGRAKVKGMAYRALRVNPWGTVDIQTSRVGAAATGAHAGVAQEVDDAIVAELAICDLIINASANSTTGSYVSAVGHETGKPVLHVWVSAGAWGARVLVQRPGKSGCWDCLAHAQSAPERLPENVIVPPVPSDPDVQEVAELGCAEMTFTGPGFDLTSAAAVAARVAVQLLLAEDDGYPAADFDLLTLGFRDADTAVPTARATRLPVHPDCEVCGHVGVVC